MSLRNTGLCTKEKGHYVLNVRKTGNEYAYVLKDKRNNKKTKFDVESEINSNVGTLNTFNM